jgi:hypothetical protein
MVAPASHSWTSGNHASPHSDVEINLEKVASVHAPQTHDVINMGEIMMPWISNGSDMGEIMMPWISNGSETQQPNDNTCEEGGSDQVGASETDEALTRALGKTPLGIKVFCKANQREHARVEDGDNESCEVDAAGGAHMCKETVQAKRPVNTKRVGGNSVRHRRVSASIHEGDHKTDMQVLEEELRQFAKSDNGSSTSSVHTALSTQTSLVKTTTQRNHAKSMTGASQQRCSSAPRTRLNDASSVRPVIGTGRPSSQTGRATARSSVEKSSLESRRAALLQRYARGSCVTARGDHGPACRSPDSGTASPERPRRPSIVVVAEVPQAVVHEAILGPTLPKVPTCMYVCMYVCA